MDQNGSLSLLIAGGILLLAFINIANPLQANRKGNFYFGLFLALWSSFYLDDVIVPKSLEGNLYFVVLKGLLQFLVPLVFYFSVLFYTRPSYSFKIADSRFAIAPAAFLIILLNKMHFSGSVFGTLLIIFFFGHSVFYVALAYLTVRKHQKNIESFVSNKEPVDLNWIKYIIYLLIGTTAISILNNMFFDTDFFKVFMNLFFLGVVYFVAYFSIRQVEIHPQAIATEEIEDTNETVFEDSAQKNKQLISDKELQAQKEIVLKLMQTEEPYLDSELNLLVLANKLSLSAHQLSYIINAGFGENFFNFINRYRAEKAKELLKNPTYDKYTILAVGFDSGFNSKTAFNTTFKKITSYTPTEYRKLRSTL